MATVGLFEAKQKLSELVERAREGEEISISRRGKIVAKLVPAEDRKPTWKEVFADIDEFRRQYKSDVPVDAPTIKELIEDGRE